MTRRCSHCNNNGHNTRTCPNRGVKLFGVRITDGSIRKSASMGNLSLHQHGGDHTPGPDHGGCGPTPDGYASEDFVPGSSSSRDRKKGVPWTEEEHRMFLLGLQKVGKGDWRGISRNYVVSRTPTQVASHAQKYFIRQSNVSRRKRRSSLFDIVADEGDDMPMESHDFLPEHPLNTQPENDNLSRLSAPILDEKCESLASSNFNSNQSEAVLSKPEPEQSGSYHTNASQNYYPVVYPTYVSPFFPCPFPYWTSYNPEPTMETHEVVKPTALHSKSPINVDELVGLSKLSLGETIGSGKHSSLSLKLLDGSSRQSAFHANPAPSSSSMNSGGSPIHAV